MDGYQKMTIKNVIDFANPKSFVASIVPAGFGILISIKYGYSVNLFRALGLLLSCVFFQASVNTINDYSDFVNGVDSKEDNLEEDDNIMFYNKIDPRSVRKLGLIFLILGIILGLISLGKIIYPSLIIGIIGLLTVLLYSGGPFPLSYLPVGEIASGFVMGGLIPLGVFTVFAEKIDPRVLALSLPLMVGIGLVMMSNNASDIEKDRRANRYTLAVCLGRRNIRVVYRISFLFWLGSELFLSYYLGGYLILIFNILIFVWKRKFLADMYKKSLLPKDRIGQMMGIGLTNIIINGSYIVGIGLSLLGA